MDIITATTAWLTNSDVPNVLLLLALLTSPATWSERITARVGAVLDRAGLPADGST